MKQFENLVTFSYGAIGDFLMILALFDEIKVEPSVRKVVLATKNISLLQALAANYPDIEIVPFTRKALFTNAPFYLKLLLSKNCVIVPPTFGLMPREVRWAAHMLAQPSHSMSVGFYDKRKVSDYKKTLTLDLDTEHLRNLTTAAQAAGLQVTYTSPTYKYTPNLAIVEKLGLQGKTYCVVHAFAANDQRSLPEDRWIDLFKQLATIKDLTVVMTGGPQDKNRADELIKKSGVAIVNAAGALSIPELATLIDASKFFIGVDTGITHLASVLRKPSIVIGNRSNPCWLPTYNDKAVILTNDKNCTCKGDKSGDCYYEINGKRYYRCMIDIPQETIIVEARTFAAR